LKMFRKKSSNYPYACTRVRAKRRFLIKKDEYLRLSVMTLPEISRYIGETQYKKEIESLSTTFSEGALIERATSSNLADTYLQIIGFCSGELKAMVGHYLGKVDAWNIKTQLRGRFHGASADEIIHEIIPAGTIKMEKHEALANMATIPDIIEGLKGTEFHSSLSRLMKEMGEGAEVTTLMPFENLIDKAYYNSLLTAVAGMKSRSTSLFTSFIRKEIDIENLTTLFKIKFDLVHHEKGIRNPEEYMISGGGELKEAELKTLLNTTSFSQFIGELQRFSFYEDMQEAAERAEERNTLNELTRQAEKHLLKQADKFAKVYPLSVLPILNYLILKKEEVDNLRIIARGKESGLEISIIRELLVV